jgi:hypothetical protein
MMFYQSWPTGYEKFARFVQELEFRNTCNWMMPLDKLLESVFLTFFLQWMKIFKRNLYLALSWIVTNQVWVLLHLTYFELNYAPWWVERTKFPYFFSTIGWWSLIAFWCAFAFVSYRLNLSFHYTPLDESKKKRFLWHFSPQWMKIFNWWLCLGYPDQN